MAMLISKFHRLIQSRLLWGFFLVVIIFTFVVWGMQTPGTGASEEATSPGKLNGKPVSQQEFRQAYFNVYMSLALMSGRSININEKLDEEMKQSAWGRLIALRKAREMGIDASDDEVLGTIQQNQGFAPEGKFNPQYFAAFVQNVLYPMGFSEPQFEAHVREEIVMQKLRHILQQTLLVSPQEQRRTYGILSDNFQVDYAVLTASNVAADVSVTEADAQKLYDADTKVFELPEMATVKYIEFPISTHLASILVTDQEAEDYYNENIEDYMNKDAPAPTNEFEMADTNRASTTPFDEVKTNIIEKLTLTMALDKASEQATDFVVSLAPDRDGNAPKFDEAAARTNLAVKQLGPFRERERLEGIEAGQAFNHAAFALNDQPDGYFSDAIEGSNVVYVVALEKKDPVRIPEFAEVKKEALEMARKIALTEALTKKAQEAREAALKGVEEGKTFKAALEPLGIKPFETGEFTVSQGLESNDYASILVRGIIAMNPGEVSELLPAEDAVLIAYVAERKPADMATFDSLRPQIVESSKRQRGQVLFEDWKKYLLREAHFEERIIPKAPDEEEDTGEEEQEPKEDRSQYQ